MFFTNIKLAKKYNYLNEKFLKAYDWLESHDLNSLPAGKYEIEDGDILKTDYTLTDLIR